jgi:hypothetical protein
MFTVYRSDTVNYLKHTLRNKFDGMNTGVTNRESRENERIFLFFSLINSLCHPFSNRRGSMPSSGYLEWARSMSFHWTRLPQSEIHIEGGDCTGGRLDKPALGKLSTEATQLHLFCRGILLQKKTDFGSSGVYRSTASTNWPTNPIPAKSFKPSAIRPVNAQRDIISDPISVEKGSLKKETRICDQLRMILFCRQGHSVTHHWRPSNFSG